MRKRVCGLLAAMMVLACVGMLAGCTDKVSFDWGEYRSDRSIAGFIDDSLVIVTDCRHWHEITEGWNGSYSEETSCGHDRMLIYNYRIQEDGPRWSDTLTNKSNGGYWKQLTDSIIWRWDGDSQKNIRLWKVGKSVHDLSLKNKLDGCSSSFEIGRMHQWLDGTFIALGGNLSAGKDSCQYAELDTAAETLTYKRLDDDLKWIQKCNDVRALKNKIYCLQTTPGASQIGLLIVDGIDQGELEKNAAIGPFWGNMLELGNDLCELTNEGMLNCAHIHWIGGLEFYKGDEVVVDLNL